jgi:hypothetical protein
MGTAVAARIGSCTNVERLLIAEARILRCGRHYATRATTIDSENKKPISG